jgi:hypothetical protein
MPMPRDPIVLYRRAPPNRDDWHFNSDCPRYPNPRAFGLEKTTPADMPPDQRQLCQTCVKLAGRSSRRPGQYDRH